MVSVMVRPVDYGLGWVMGDDWEARVPVDWTILQLRDFVARERGLHKLRLVVRMPDGKYLDERKEKWSMRRFQFKDGTTVQVEPTLSGAWTWNDAEWYRERLLADILALLDAAVGSFAEDHVLTTKDLEERGIKVPPPLGDISLRTFIRSHPEVFHMHADITSCLYWVKRAQQLHMVPTFSAYSQQLGFSKHYVMNKRFNWSKYEDIDDRKRIELDFEIPDVSYNLEIVRASDIMRADVFGSSDPIGFVKWWNCVEWVDVGKTSQRRNTLNPEWRDARFVVSVNASFEVDSCILLIELYDMDSASSPGEEDTLGDFLGAVELTGRALTRLVADGRTSITNYPLLPREASKREEDEDHSGVKGTMMLKGGKAGFEICVQAARDLVVLPNPSSRSFVVVVWCGDELGVSLPDNKSARDPQWNETFGIPTMGASTKLEECSLEVQVWGTMGRSDDPDAPADYDPDAKGQFMGSVQVVGEDLVTFLTSSMPYALSIRKVLKQSKNVPIKMRKKPTGGILCLLGGLSGLAVQPGKVIDFTIMYADRIAKLFKVWFSVDWNYVRTYSSTHQRVLDARSTWNERVRVETSAGALTCIDSHLRIDMYESTEGSIGALDPAYLGMIIIEKEELSELADNPFAQIKNYVLVMNPSMEAKKQRLIRGKIFVRGGGVQCRCEDERILIIQAAKNLARANFGGFGSSDPFCEITFNGKLVGTTKVIEKSLNPRWDDEAFFIPIPPIREYNEKEIKAFLKLNEKRERDGLPPKERTMYDEMVLQVAVFDEAGEGEKGTCLGVLRFEEAELLAFFESYEPIDEWYPLVRGKDPETSRASIGVGAEIKVGTCGHKWISPEARRLEEERAMEAERQRIEDLRLEAEALEFARLEALRVEEERLKKDEADAKKAEADRADAAAAESERLFKEKLAAKAAAEA